MSKIPDSVNHEFVSGLTMISRGKVRDTYALANDAMVLPVATDRVSIFDFVLPAEVPQKGEVLTAMNVFWASRIARRVEQDIIAFGRNIDAHLPEEHRGNAELQKRATVVEKLNTIPVEAIVRGYLTGSGWTAYANTAPNHLLCGHTLPPGIKDGDRLPFPIFTPTTKAIEGHDEHMLAQNVAARFGHRIEAISLDIFGVVSNIALGRRIIVADSKFEFGLAPKTRKLKLCDERFTPDSSRFWLLDDWKRSREKGVSPTSFDKQFVRKWGKTVDIHTLDPLRPEDVFYVHSLTVPEHILASTAHLYRYIFYLVTGMRLETFQHNEMHIVTTLPPVEIVLGSESDISQVEKGLDLLRKSKVSFRLHVVSCHRNPDALREYAQTMVPHNATVIAAAGKAAALPGVLHAWLRHYRKAYIPVLGVALTGNDSLDMAAARLSIERLPETPVILKAKDEAYKGPNGFAAACRDALAKEFFIPSGTLKEPKFNLVSNT